MNTKYEGNPNQNNAPIQRSLEVDSHRQGPCPGQPKKDTGEDGETKYDKGDDGDKDDIKKND